MNHVSQGENRRKGKLVKLVIIHFSPDPLVKRQTSQANAPKKEGETIMIFICYPRCTTCQKAKKWLQENGVAFVERHIKDDNPTVEELKEWHRISGLPLKRFFNTSSQQYRQLKIKDKLPSMSEDEQYELLASDGMLVKRPILVGDGFVLVGFNQTGWQEALGIG